MTIFDPAPTRLDEVLDPIWLGQMLSARWPGVAVHGVEVVELLVTMATKVRLKLAVAGAPEAPTEICIKGVLTDTGLVASASIVETLFYAEMAEQLPLRLPSCIHASLNAASNNGVIVMRDLVAAGARFSTPLEPFSPDDVRRGLAQLASLHAVAWQDSAFFALPWPMLFLDRISTNPILPMETLQGLLDDPRGNPLPPELKDAKQLMLAMQAFAAQVRTMPNCLVHGDAHAGNIFRDTDGAIGIVDWQVLQKGEWSQDVAYHIAAVLTPEDRRTHERALLAYYLDQLQEHGGPQINAETAWDRYRAAMVYGYFMWATTRKVEPAITYEFVRRLGFAVDDLESYSAVRD